MNRYTVKIDLGEYHIVVAVWAHTEDAAWLEALDIAHQLAGDDHARYAEISVGKPQKA